MTEEYRLTPQRISEIMALIIIKDPKITEIDEVVKRHVEKNHRFRKDPYYQKMESEHEHINAILTGRRNLNELT